MNHSGATSALRGYRRQTLYALSKIVEVQDDKAIFQLELHEDFAVIEPSGTALEVVQVKDYSDDLGFSILQDFFHRAALRLRSDSDVKNKVVSFGIVGPELNNAWQKEGKDRDKVRAKLSRPFKPKNEGEEVKLSKADVDLVFRSVEIEKVNRPPAKVG